MRSIAIALVRGYQRVFSLLLGPKGIECLFCFFSTKHSVCPTKTDEGAQDYCHSRESYIVGLEHKSRMLHSTVVVVQYS